MIKRTARMAITLLLAMLTVQNTLAATKTDLVAAISEAEAYQSSIQESNPKQAELLAVFINTCKGVQNDADAPQEDVDFATSLVNESVKECKIAVAQANYAVAISEAEEYFATIKDNHPAQAEKLNNIIINAKTFMENTLVDVLEVLTQSVRLGIDQIKLEVAQADYAAVISNAEEYMASLQEKHPEQAKKMATIIENAKTFMENTSVDVLEILTESVKLGIQQMQLEVAQADYAAAISDAEAYLATIQETHPDQAQKLTNVINNSKSMAGSGTSMEVLDFLAKVLNEGVKEFKMEIAHIDLAAAISDAEAYMGTIQESNPSVASAIQFLIDASKRVEADDSYTQADLEYTTAFMKAVVVQAKEIVTTGVSAVRAAEAMAGKLFDLQGRQLSAPSHSGVYINNGVKVAIK